MKHVSVKGEGAVILETPQAIPRAEWRGRLDLFSAQHAGWLTTIELFENGENPRIQARELPFEGINVDKENANKIEITVERDPTDRMTHIVENARKIVWQTPDELEIESSDGTRTAVRCHRKG